MFGIRIIPFLLVFTCVFLSGCHKENGKHTYEMRLMFDSGDVFTSSGTIAENKLKRRRGQELIVHVFNKYTFLKVKDNKFVCSYILYLNSNKPVAFANGMTGSFKGDVYFEGTYTQKGRAYTVDDGYFEFIWRNMTTGEPMSSIVYKGKWTLKRT
ncbi:hypothetical protein [Fluviicola sp.]|jgi:hypothetical protein|uniref:hypothetical protein n=1 Tax=Fluviicola sp. TaxID=1917219 RepID=UPI0028209F07|nr:hypothetical protein [Fluviicola sp.]MDR0803228.1 hypothetical protein [Fluviicola sp.]